MKKKILNIEKISVKSFVVGLEDKNSNTVKGGFWTYGGCSIRICEQGGTDVGEQTCEPFSYFDC